MRKPDLNIQFTYVCRQTYLPRFPLSRLFWEGLGGHDNTAASLDPNSKRTTNNLMASEVHAKEYGCPRFSVRWRRPQIRADSRESRIFLRRLCVVCLGELGSEGRVEDSKVGVRYVVQQ